MHTTSGQILMVNLRFQKRKKWWFQEISLHIYSWVNLTQGVSWVPKFARSFKSVDTRPLSRNSWTFNPSWQWKYSTTATVRAFENFFTLDLLDLLLTLFECKKQGGKNSKYATFQSAHGDKARLISHWKGYKKGEFLSKCWDANNLSTIWCDTRSHFCWPKSFTTNCKGSNWDSF